MVIPSPPVLPFDKANPLSWHKILLDILFNTIFLLTWEDVCEGGWSFGRLLNPHEHKRTSNVFQSDVIFIFCLSYLHWQRSRGEVVVQIGWDFSTCGPRSMFNQFFTLLSRPGKAEWTICLFKMLRCGDFFSLAFTIHPWAGAIFAESWDGIQIGTSWVDWMRRWRRDKKFFHQLTPTCPGPPFFRF